MAKRKAKRKTTLPKARRNPRPAEPSAEIERAAKLFREFREDEPGKVTQVQIDMPRAAMQVGEIDAIAYRTYEGGKLVKYLHRFQRDARPTLLAGSNGRTLIIYGGKFTFTGRGIVDGRRSSR